MARPSQAMSRIAQVLTVSQSGPKCTGTIIALHGAGACGPSILEWWSDQMGEKLSFPETRVLFPTAAAMPYALYGGEVANVWLDRTDVDLEVKEIGASIDAASDSINALIDTEVERGIPRNRIVVGGFSQGGTLALHVGYGAASGLAGVFAMSSFINRGSQLYSRMDARSGQLPPLFQSHGTRDALVRYAWGGETHRQLTKRGVEAGEGLVTAQGVEHQLDRGTLTKLHAWLAKTLPAIV